MSVPESVKGFSRLKEVKGAEIFNVDGYGPVMMLPGESDNNITSIVMLLGGFCDGIARLPGDPEGISGLRITTDKIDCYDSIVPWGNNTFASGNAITPREFFDERELRQHPVEKRLEYVRNALRNMNAYVVDLGNEKDPDYRLMPPKMPYIVHNYLIHKSGTVDATAQHEGQVDNESYAIRHQDFIAFKNLMGDAVKDYTEEPSTLAEVEDIERARKRIGNSL